MPQLVLLLFELMLGFLQRPALLLQFLVRNPQILALRLEFFGLPLVIYNAGAQEVVREIAARPGEGLRLFALRIGRGGR